MRAVNLIPAGGGRDGRGSQSVAPWAVLGVLGLLLAGVLTYVLTNNQVVDRRAQLAAVQDQVRVVQAQADAGRPYKEFASLAQARVETIRQLGSARFDWHRAFGDLARVLPGDVWLSSLLGTVAPGITIAGAASGNTGALRAALPNPAIELTGCTTGQDGVARLISRLRLMTGVARVSLSQSTSGDTSGPGGAGDCRYGHKGFAEFGIVVFFRPIPAVPAPVQPGAAGADAAPAAVPAAAAAPSGDGNGSGGR